MSLNEEKITELNRALEYADAQARKEFGRTIPDMFSPNGFFMSVIIDTMVTIVKDRLEITDEEWLIAVKESMLAEVRKRHKEALDLKKEVEKQQRIAQIMQPGPLPPNFKNGN